MQANLPPLFPSRSSAMTRIPPTIGMVIAAGLLVAALIGSAADLPSGKEFANSIGMKLVRIEAGEFVMGNGESPPRTREEWNDRDWDESPAHQVKISKPF